MLRSAPPSDPRYSERTSRWTGERLDLDWAIAVLGQRWAPENVSEETSAGRSSSVPFSVDVREVLCDQEVHVGYTDLTTAHRNIVTDPLY